MSIRKIARYGWRRQILDHRDLKLAAPPPLVLPTSIDLSTSLFMPQVYDQGQLGSCTANAIAAAVDFERASQKESFLTPSRLFIYYNERVIEGDPDEDGGAEIRDGMKTIASQGVCPETEWPYDESQVLVKPPASCYTDATKFIATQYVSVAQDSYHLRYMLGIAKKPIVFGFSVYDDFESDQVAETGLLSLPGGNDSPIGGHAVMIVGYDDSRSLFKVRNSWGSDWGQAGYFQMPYTYVLDQDLASDFWTIKLVS